MRQREKESIKGKREKERKRELKGKDTKRDSVKCK